VRTWALSGSAVTDAIAVSGARILSGELADLVNSCTHIEKMPPLPTLNCATAAHLPLMAGDGSYEAPRHADAGAATLARSDANATCNFTL
jgi:hypothetical protein